MRLHEIAEIQKKDCNKELIFRFCGDLSWYTFMDHLCLCDEHGNKKYSVSVTVPMLIRDDWEIIEKLNVCPLCNSCARLVKNSADIEWKIACSRDEKRINCGFALFRKDSDGYRQYSETVPELIGRWNSLSRS